MSSWTTRANEQVAIGDLVALSLLAHSDAVARIVAEADGDKIQCELVRGGNARPGYRVTVEESQLLVRVYG